MSFSGMLELLQEKNKNKLVLIKSGVFYIATGKDAIFLNKELGFKCICFKKQVCKIGIPATRIEHYLKKLEELNIGYIVYYFESKKEELTVKYEKEGNYHKEICTHNNCTICKQTKEQKEDKYTKAIQKIFKEDIN